MDAERRRIRMAQSNALRELRAYAMLIPGPWVARFEAYADTIDRATRAPRGKRK
jgi:hypothetical protein